MSLLWSSLVANCEDCTLVVVVNGCNIVTKVLDAQTCEIISELRYSRRLRIFRTAGPERERKCFGCNRGFN
jgi:hypothetical protein